MKKRQQLRVLSRRSDALSTLIDVKGLISSWLNLDQILENAMTIFKQVMNVDASSLMLLDEKMHRSLMERQRLVKDMVPARTVRRVSCRRKPRNR